MNEEFKKWWDNYVPQVAHYIATNKEIAEDAWNASREAMTKEKRFECHVNKRQGIIFPDCILGTENERFPRHSYCLYNEFNKLAKTDCPFWREVK